MTFDQYIRNRKAFKMLYPQLTGKQIEARAKDEQFMRESEDRMPLYWCYQEIDRTSFNKENQFT